MYGYVYIKLYVYMFAGGKRVLNNVYNTLYNGTFNICPTYNYNVMSRYKSSKTLII